MCGISGIVSLKDEKIDVASLKRMTAIISYRGPDQSGFATFAGGSVGLAHVRLAIQDPHAAPQPLVKTIDDDVVALCYNGEIYGLEEHRQRLSAYGYSFHTTTDTEVILALYLHLGIDFLQTLNGEFTFLIYDSRVRRLIACRDRFGIKPLFYHRDERQIIFASEAKAILSHHSVPQRFATNFLSHHLWGVFDSSESPFEAIHCVPPGHFLRIENTHCHSPQPYWRPTFDTQFSMTRQEAETGLRDRLQTAVQRRLVADAPICTYLSGGIDSALVTGLASQKIPLHAFNISFCDSDFDERQAASEIASFYGVAYISIPCPPERLAANMIETVWHTEQFFPNPSAIGKYILSSEVHARGFKVALTGEGSDEILAGYPTFKIETLWRLAGSACNNIRDKAHRLLTRFKKLERRSEGLLWNSTSKWKSLPHPFGYPSAVHVRAAVFDRFRRITLQDESLRTGPPATDAFSRYDVDIVTPIHPLQTSMVIGYHHLASWIFPCLGDRLEMAHHVEGRTPFLDNDVVDFVSTIPPNYLIDIENLQEKAVLYGAFDDFLPHATAASHKHPFFAPSWVCLLESPSGRLLSEKFLSYGALRSANVFRPGVVLLARFLWQYIVPRDTVLFRRIDAFIGVVICINVMHHHFIASRPGADIDMAKKTKSMDCMFVG
jgi:asparagine synthase (glutamine-hydrolysing)